MPQADAWEVSYYAALTDDIKWKSGAESERFDAAGVELAHELTVELGPDVEVEYHSYLGPGAKTHFRSRGPASNPAAQKAFSARATTQREERSRLHAIRPTGAPLSRQAEGPSGEVFRPR